MPPPSVSPPTPVDEMNPHGTASPNGCVAWSTSPHNAAAFDAHGAFGGIDVDTAHLREVDDQPIVAGCRVLPPLCPPPRTAVSRLLVRA